ncbi:MAG: hypothetical protein AAGE96_19920 [Cyanobacteria bacterium P01_G01_bin.19]
MTKWIHLSSRVMGNYHARFRTRGERWKHPPRLFSTNTTDSPTTIKTYR